MPRKDSVVGVIRSEGNVLIGKKRRDSKSSLAGKWHVPGGKKYDGESDVVALKREIFQETGLDITVGKFIGESLTPSGRKAKWYECFANYEGALIPGDDLEDAKWIDRKKVLEVCASRVEYWSEEVRNYFR